MTSLENTTSGDHTLGIDGNMILDDMLGSILWEGKIPIIFQLSENEITSNQRPNPCFVLASRLSYLPMVASDAITYLQNSVLQYTSMIWFEYNHYPLKANLPLGVLFDMTTENSNNNKLPWIVTIHFQSFPFNQIVNCSTLKDSERYYNHSLKQALYLLHGNTNAFNSLTIECKQSVWNSVCTGDYNTFQQVSRDLISTTSTIKKLPIKFIKLGYPTVQINIDTTRVILLKDVIDKLDDHDMNSRLLVHGIDISCHLNVPIYDIWKLFYHGDLFMYIIISTK